jgi:hypothetical protein
MPVQCPGQGVAEIAQEMPAVPDLDGLGCAAPDPVGIAAGTVAGDDLDARMALQPRLNRLRVAVRSRSTGRWRSRSTIKVP